MGRGDPLGSDDAVTPVADQSESHEQGAEHAELHEQPGHEQLVGVLCADDRRDGLQQWPEEDEVQDRLRRVHHGPDRVAERAPDGPPEHGEEVSMRRMVVFPAP